MELIHYAKEIGATTYPGRGILLGKSKSGKYAVIAYFIMGRSQNSRNRIFTPQEDGISTEAFDPSKLVDPSLIIYAPVRVLGDDTIVTNGDQTDTIYDFMAQGKTFEDALRTRTFEPDPPNYTPASAVLSIRTATISFQFSRARTAIPIPRSASSLITTTPPPVRDTSFILTSVTAIPFPATRANPHGSKSTPTPLTNSPTRCGTR